MVSPKTCFHQKKMFSPTKNLFHHNTCFEQKHIITKKYAFTREPLFKKIYLPKNMLMQNYPKDQNGPKWSYIFPNGHKVSKIVRNGLNRKNCPKS